MCFLLSLLFSLQQNRRIIGQNNFHPGGGGTGREIAQTMYTQVSKCKTDKRREKKISSTSVEPLNTLYKN
jgi:hypothetical protein